MKRVRITFDGHTEDLSVCDFTPESAIRATLHRYFSIEADVDSLYFCLPNSTRFTFPARIPDDLHLHLRFDRPSSPGKPLHPESKSAQFPEKQSDNEALPALPPPSFNNAIADAAPTINPEFRRPEIVATPSYARDRNGIRVTPTCRSQANEQATWAFPGLGEKREKTGKNAWRVFDPLSERFELRAEDCEAICLALSRVLDPNIFSKQNPNSDLDKALYDLDRQLMLGLSFGPGKSLHPAQFPEKRSKQNPDNAIRGICVCAREAMMGADCVQRAL
jgi:hypothetical protein